MFTLSKKALLGKTLAWHFMANIYMKDTNKTLKKNFMEQQQKENSSENKIEVPTKNPWWVKALPHFYIIVLFLDIIATQSMMDMLEILIWIYFGMRIQSDKFIIAKTFRIYFILIMGVMGIGFYPHILELIKKVYLQF